MHALAAPFVAAPFDVILLADPGVAMFGAAPLAAGLGLA